MLQFFLDGDTIPAFEADGAASAAFISAAVVVEGFTMAGAATAAFKPSASFEADGAASMAFVSRAIAVSHFAMPGAATANFYGPSQGGWIRSLSSRYRKVRRHHGRRTQ